MLISFLRTIILYLLLIASIRLMGKRQLGKMEPTEFVVTMLVANLAAVPMQESGIPLLAGAVPILVVLAMELLLSVLSYHSIKFRRLICGKPVILIENGRLMQRNLQKTRVTPDGHVAHFPGGHIHQTPHFRVFIIVGEQIEIQRTNGPCRGLASVNIGIEHIGSLSQGSNLNRLRLKTFPAYSDLSHSGFHPVNRPKPGLTVLYCDSGNVLVLHRPVQGCRIGIRRFYGQGNLPFGGIGVDFRRHRE